MRMFTLIQLLAIIKKKMWNWFKKKNSDKINKEQAKLRALDDEQEDKLIIRNPIEVAERILALLAVIGKVHQGNDNRFMNWFCIQIFFYNI